MSTPDRTAAGQAAGYHFQIQHALLSILRSGPNAEVAIETLDDVAVTDETSGHSTLEQLKHSIRPGSLSDRSRPLWNALNAWMDLAETGRLDEVSELLLVATQTGKDGSAAAALRLGGSPTPRAAAERLLLAAAQQARGADTATARARFIALRPADRKKLLAKIRVADSTAGIGDFRAELLDAVGLATPRVAVDDFLDRLVGWWERRAVDMLLGRRKTVTRDEVADEIARIRDEYTDRTLPAADPALAAEVTEALVAAYKGYPFVHQLEMIAVKDARLQLLIADYHRAFSQRARWLEDGILGPDELSEWEDRLADEWAHAFARMCDEVGNDSPEEQQAHAGRELYGDLEQSDLSPLRDGRDRFLHVGTWHGLSDTRRVGWHPDFQARLTALLGPPAASSSTSAAYEKVKRERGG
jgi:hypothetical protein